MNVKISVTYRLMKIKGDNGCESWTVKKAEHQRIDAFELWC